MKNKVFLLFFVTGFLTLSPTIIFANFEDNPGLTNDLISYWSFDDVEALGNDDHGTNNLENLNQVFQTAGVLAGAADFVREDDKHFSIADNVQSGLDIGGSISISLWVNFKDLEEHQIFLHKYHGNNNDRGYNFYWDSPELIACLSEVGSVGNCKRIPYVFSLNQWYHLVFTWDSENDLGRMYVNGSQIGADLVYGISHILNNNQPLFVGTNEYIETMNGYIDELGIWGRALSSVEVTSLYNQGAGLAYKDEQVNYPLYTQIESPYPSVLETRDWADDTMPCGTIAVCGCTISSLVSGADFFGFDEDVLGQTPTPKTFNAYLSSVGGYSSTGVLSWLAASAYFGEVQASGTLATRLQYPPVFVSDDVNSETQSYLEQDNTLVLGFEELNADSGYGHFVWLPDYTDSTYVVRDPNWYETKVANDSSGNASTTDYGNDFDEARVYTVLNEPEEFSGNEIEAIVTGTAELLYKNALGDKVGFDDGIVVLDLERASYGNVRSVAVNGNGEQGKGKNLLLHDAGTEFTIDVIGTEAGEYTVEFFTITSTGTIQSYLFKGTTLPGLTTTFSFNLETGEVVEQEILYEDFLALVEQELVGYSAQQKKFFLKWAEKIFEKAEEKSTTQLLQAIDTYKKLLVAKKVDSELLINALDLLVN